MDTRKQVRVYLNDREYGAAKSESELRGQSVSAFLRHCLHKEAAEARETRTFLVRQLAGQREFDYTRGLLGASDNTEAEGISQGEEPRP